MKFAELPPEMLIDLAIERVRHNGIARSARCAEDNDVAAHGDRFEIAGEGGLPHTVEDKLHAASPGYALHLACEVLAGIDDRVVGARLARGTGLLFGRNSSDHLRSEPFRPLYEQQPDSACSGMDQHRISVLHFRKSCSR